MTMGLRVPASLLLMVALSVTMLEPCAGARDAGHRTKENYIAEKVKQMTELNYRRPLIRLKGDQFKNLVKNAPKNYSVIVMLTALQPQRQCQICQQAHDEFQIIANSWRYSQVWTHTEVGVSGHKIFITVNQYLFFFFLS